MSDPRSRGFSLLETVMALIVMAILAGILVPIVTQYIDDARIARAAGDVKAIAEAIGRFERDLGRYPMFTASSGFLPNSAANVVRLEGPGTAPTATDTTWTSATPTDTDCTAGCTFDLFADQFIVNAPGYPVTSSSAKPFKWKGPYIEVSGDPWGRKYLSNIINAKSTSPNAAFVISAGPDGNVQTSFNPLVGAELTPSGDDILFRIR
jgi:general secretion pathway protein G